MTTFGILDKTALNRLAQDLREADWQVKHGDPALAAHLRLQVEELRQLDFEIRQMQILESGLTG